MGYVLFFLVFLVLTSGTGLYLTRQRWLHLVPEVYIGLPRPGSILYERLPFSFTNSALYQRLPSTFSGDIEAGLSSDTFSLAGNVDSGDSRAGLDDAAKAEILKIMKKRRMKFDEARRVYMERRFSQNNIGPDGRPRDPKLVTFS
ncbi:uncharacterized protein B0I36DRAFT_232893 [Microdochium trichocladiopsis]|uniref:Uncharacterized protein n=1 Tax=Microdochium trichocladiopsis TaxID=1682393 RepID=A0A9P9BWU2_9PEZI|nr:uncharacterized protein B0I36DRAFT_232893 [Microdochium trichocladiopsis]KAH7041127.1 hypothetical protein B0I36DRAFT_232893 [Microdochium trichocladiopsis]